MSTDQLARTLIFLGGLLVVVGLAIHFSKHVPFLGRLPGDIRIERPGMSFYFPITTGILISLVLSAILYLLSRHR